MVTRKEHLRAGAHQRNQKLYAFCSAASLHQTSFFETIQYILSPWKSVSLALSASKLVTRYLRVREADLRERGALLPTYMPSHFLWQSLLPNALAQQTRLPSPHPVYLHPTPLHQPTVAIRAYHRTIAMGSNAKRRANRANIQPHQDRQTSQEPAREEPAQDGHTGKALDKVERAEDECAEDRQADVKQAGDERAVDTNAHMPNPSMQPLFTIARGGRWCHGREIHHVVSRGQVGCLMWDAAAGVRRTPGTSEHHRAIPAV